MADLADTQNIDIFALSETWISGNTTSAQQFDVISRGFTFINTPRLVPDSCTSSIVGGGTSFLLREPCKLFSTPTISFQSLDVHISRSNFLTLIYNIYRPSFRNLGLP